MTILLKSNLLNLPKVPKFKAFWLGFKLFFKKIFPYL
jgi:hypothetical protein